MTEPVDIKAYEGSGFADWSMNEKFPFTDGSTMTCTDGRRLPVSFFVTLVLYPPFPGAYRLSEITGDSLVFSDNTDSWTASAPMNEYMNGWLPVYRNGNVVGSAVLRYEDVAYVKGMASVSRMYFADGDADIRSECARCFMLPQDNITEVPIINGYDADKVDAVFTSGRFSSGAVKDFDNTANYGNDRHHPITKINGTQMDDGIIRIAAPVWSDLQFVPSNDGITAYQRG